MTPFEAQAACRQIHREQSELLVGRTMVIPRGPYRGRAAKIDQVTIVDGKLSVWVLIPGVEGGMVEYLRNDSARRWQSWNIEEVGALT